MPPRLKVFVTSDGLTDYVVAVSSRPKALAAWGVRQDLFKEGRAEETHDAALVEAALAKPGEVIAKGRDGALRTLKAARAPKPTSKPTAARSRRVEKLAAELDALEAAFARRQADLKSERERLERQATEETQAFETRRNRLVDRLANARKAKPR